MVLVMGVVAVMAVSAVRFVVRFTARFTPGFTAQLTARRRAAL